MAESKRSNADRLAILLDWFEENKITFNQEAIEVVEHKSAKRGSNIISSDGFGIVARRDLEDEEPLVVIPKTAIISAATSALANIFHDEELGGSLALCIAVMYEMSLGELSPWYGYLQSLPVNTDIPLLWNEQARQWLRGTDVAGLIERDEQNLKDDFASLQDLVSEYPHVFISQNGVDWASRSCFLNVASLVSSRAFSVDIHRGNSMVPFADIFNHKTSGENVHIEIENTVCPLCGEAFGCEHMDGLEEMDAEEHSEMHTDEGQDHVHSDCDSSCDDSEMSQSDEEDEDEDQEVGEEMPLLVDVNGNPIDEDDMEIDGDDPMGESDGADDGFEDVDSEDESDGEGADDEEDKWIDSLDMVVFKPCRANSEVFNTYGEHGSAYLLHRYGFCDTQNPFEAVSLDVHEVIKAFGVAKSDKRAADITDLIARHRPLFATRHRAKDDEDEDEDGDEESDVGDEDDEGGATSCSASDNSSDSGDSETDDMPEFSIDAPGHPSTNLAAILVLGLSDESVFAQLVQSSSLFRHYFPAMCRFWTVFQNRLDDGASVAAALRDANKETTVKKSSVVLAARVVVALSERRLSVLGEDSAALGAKPTDPQQLLRWESAKQLRSNERKTLQQCIKTYKKVMNKLSS
ncbi:hypothetical protein GGI15_000382 [Coemansia interrupta]|uniref:Apoptosis regulator Bcl-2 family BH4 domain-containing protein n=1 Tax=Coemansia interrupta TaxID=1126814 RepID=A0A9W8HSB1_9FUNG|nr:hypothetical protein GGI15_000382 [Coemansia interrupta]